MALWNEELRDNPKLLASFTAAGILYLAIIGLLISWWDSYAALSAIVGLSCGWASGILLAPYDEEAKKFKGYSKAVGGFITGFLIGKLDKVFDTLTEKDHDASRLYDPLIERRIWIAIVSFLVTAIAVFVARTYWQALEDTDEVSQ